MAKKNPTETSSFAQLLNESAFLWRLLKAVLILLICFQAMRLTCSDWFGKFEYLTDFNAFHVAGTLALKGRLPEAYHASQMHAALIEQTGTEGFMPWTYPLPFNLITSAIALLPIGAGYFLFAALSLLSFLVVMKHLLGEEYRLVIFLFLPSLLINIACGQNGTMTGALIGLFCYWHLKRSTLAGIPIGLMVIKPHLVAALCLYLIFRRDWRTIVVAGASALSMIAIATLNYGLPVWSDFFSSVDESTAILLEGRYPLFRMTSGYAALYTMTHEEYWAIICQIGSIILALMTLVWVITSKTSSRNALGLACLVSAFFSPYFYDYDLPIFGVGIGLLIPALRSSLTTRQQAFVVSALILAQAGWFRLTFLELVLDTALEAAPDMLSLSFPALLAVTYVSLRAANKHKKPGLLGITDTPILLSYLPQNPKNP